ncbi:hypothetical protein like AT1G45063 [Hibiscus trionum]|uniref:Phytocyanin domain-containing protein n=1 Tax=Hibiscus trionum TaxID=183268 RepID=A0A9W7HYH5_HIBTR|nr:hypothetical protein like AT1G45063 [Hibiscus trionum]
MGREISTAALFVFLVANLLLQSAYGTTYTVGDSTGWGIPTGNDDFYDDWADNKIFAVGDVLVFNFTTGQHNVAEVTEAAYDACNAANTLFTVNNGPARITLNRTGEHHFICAFPGHCSAGQKLNIEVRSGGGTGPAPTPRPSPSPSPSPSGRTYTVGDATGWRVPVGNDDFYDDWNDNKIFHVGDVLVFNFTTGQHNVAEVTEADYEACNTANPISTVSTGPARITLNRTGEHYFICAIPGHCSAGQKLEVEVRNGNRTGIAPTPTPTTPGTPSGTTYTVGDSTGWRVPTGNDDFYDDWADNKEFGIGDVLVFNFTNGQHNVVEVTEAGYDSCSTTNAISTVSNGPARITLNRTGEHYFICGFPGHCAAGQKLNVEVHRTGTAPGVPGTPGATTPGTSGPPGPGANSASSAVATVSLALFMYFSSALLF